MKARKPLLVGIFVFLATMAFTQLLTYQQFLISRNTELEKVGAEARKISDNLKASLTHSLSATKTLAFLVEHYGVPAHFDSIGQAIIEANQNIDAIELTRQGRIIHVFPLGGNEDAIGYDVLADTMRNVEAKKAIDKGALFFAGPFELKQGGMAVVGRLPIFKNGEFWGFSAVLIKLSTLLRAAGIDHHSNQNFSYQISKQNPNTGREEFFLPLQDVTFNDYVTVQVPDGEWKLYVVSKSDTIIWKILPFFLLGLMLSITGGLFAFHFVGQPELLRKQVDKISREMRLLQEENTATLERANKLYHVISRVNHTMIHVDNEENLYHRVCTIAHEIGKYKLAWVGEVDHKKSEIRVRCSSGSKAYLQEITPISLRDGKREGPALKSLMTGAYVFSNNIATDPLMKPWAAKAQAHGYKSYIVLPIRKFKEVVGIFVLYSDQVDYFDKREIDLLVETSNNISFTLENLEKEKMRNLAEEQIKNEKVFSDSIINSLPGIFYLYDRKGRFVRWNRNFEIVSGRSREEISKMSPLDFFPQHEKAILKESIEGVFKTGYGEVAADFCTTNGEVPYYFNGRKVIVNETELLVGMGLDITDRVRAEKAVAERTEEIERLSAYLQTIREEERSVIALEIHDVLGQQLTALKMDSTWVKRKVESDSEIAARLSQMIQLIDDTIKTVRKISSDLRPGILDDLGIVAAVEWQGQQFEKNTNIKFYLESNIPDLELDRSLAINVFRVFQEALTNIARHAQASEVRTSLIVKDGVLRITVSDNGVGIDAEEAKRKRSLGIVGMRERARLFKGSVAVERIDPKGTIVKLQVPLSNQTDHYEDPHS